MAETLRSSLSPLRARGPRLPRALPEPATIGVCALSGRVNEAQLAKAVDYLHDLGHRVIVLHDRLDGSLHHGTRELAHGEHLELERPELVVKVFPGLLHQPNRPVT